MDNQLLFNRDVKMIGSPGPNASNNFFDHVKNNPNMTWYGVVWCTTEWFIAEGAAIPCRYSHEVGRPFTSPRRHQDEKKMMFYSVFYNYTNEDSAFFKMLQLPAPIDPVLLRLKLSVDNSIMRYLGVERQLIEDEIPKIDISHSSYPIIADRLVKDSNAVSQLGGYFFVLGPLLSFTIMINEIVREKELRLRQVRHYCN